jgi:hypothetical protein
MKEAPVLEGKMGNWVSSVSDSPFEVVSAIYFVEPDSELGVSYSWRAESVEFCDFDPIAQ